MWFCPIYTTLFMYIVVTTKFWYILNFETQIQFNWFANAFFVFQHYAAFWHFI